MNLKLFVERESYLFPLEGVQAGPGPQEVQEGEGKAVDPLQAKSLPAHRHPLLAEGQGKKNWPIQEFQTISMGDMPI